MAPADGADGGDSGGLRAGDPLSDQLFEQVGIQNACEDAMYELERAFSKDAMDINVFLKAIRKLSNDQFMAKALAKKVCASS